MRYYARQLLLFVIIDNYVSKQILETPQVALMVVLIPCSSTLQHENICETLLISFTVKNKDKGSNVTHTTLCVSLSLLLSLFYVHSIPWNSVWARAALYREGATILRNSMDRVMCSISEFLCKKSYWLNCTYTFFSMLKCNLPIRQMGPFTSWQLVPYLHCWHKSWSPLCHFIVITTIWTH